ncbi:MAG: tyrosine-type recombinase/integrase [Planctomycetes bacterium]|nr:tyrosine-type recombinase/integrase [Planctomycetota bacterium]
MFKRSRGVWWTCIRHEGRKIQRSLETTDKKLGKSIEAKIRTEIVKGKYYEWSGGRNKRFNEMMEKFLIEYAPNVSENMQRSYGYYLKNLRAYFGNPKLDTIAPKLIAGYKVHRRNKGASSSTINRELYMLSKAFNLAVKEWEWLRENPVSKVSKESENNERGRWLSDKEETALLRKCPDWLCDIIAFALQTGLRQDELLSLEWSRVDESRKTILIQRTKNGKPKTVPLSNTALSILKKKTLRSLKNGLVFFSANGTKISRHNLGRAFRNALDKAGIEDFRFHDLRHIFATRLVQRGEDIYKVAMLMGHKDIRMTQRYAHHCPDSLRDCVKVLEKCDYNVTTIEKKESLEHS